MKAYIRVEEEETDQETQEWKKEIKETRDRIKSKQPPPPAPDQTPGQPAP